MERSPLTKEQNLPTLRGMFRKILQQGFTAEHLLTEHFKTLNPHTLVERAGSNDLGTHWFRKALNSVIYRKRQRNQ